MKSEHKGTLYWLQIRPIVDKKEMLDDSILDVDDNDLILRSESALGHGVMEGVRHVVYVKPKSFNSMRNPEVAKEIEQINKDFIDRNEPYILIGPGRWGSSDPALGVLKCVGTADSRARLIVESALPGYHIEPPQGTHFFQNLTSFGVGYFTVDPVHKKGFYDDTYLDSMPAVYESDTVRIVRFENPLVIAINGRKGRGIVRKA